MMGSMAERRRSSRLMTPKTPRFWPEMKTRRGFCASWPRYSLVDIGPLDRTAGECLGAVNDVPQGVAVVRVVGYRPGVQHEQATGSAAVGGDDGGLDAELVRRGGLSFADALDLRGMEGIELPAALTLLLRADLRGPAKRERERRLEGWLALDLAADVADDPAQPAAQDTQLPLMSLELFGMGVAASHHRGGLGDPEIGLPQPDAVPGRQTVEPLDGRMQQLGIGRKGDVLRLHRGVDRDPLEVLAAQCPGSCATRRLSASSNSSLSPSRLRQWLRSERSCGKSCWKNSSPVKNWKYGS